MPKKISEKEKLMMQDMDEIIDDIRKNARMISDMAMKRKVNTVKLYAACKLICEGIKTGLSEDEIAVMDELVVSWIKAAKEVREAQVWSKANVS